MTDQREPGAGSGPVGGGTGGGDGDRTGGDDRTPGLRRVARPDELTPDQRRLVLALIAAKKASDKETPME